jgi:LemA protein
MILWIALGALGLVALVATGLYNRLVSLRNEVEAAWRQIDVQVQRRHDLIPNLLETVRGYAAHEREVLEGVAHARADAVRARDSRALERSAGAEAALGRALANVNAVVERYPELKADQHFVRLLTDLSDTENRIASARRIYNASVQTFNTALERMPGAAIGAAAGLTRRPYYELPADAPERQVPRVTF